MGAENDIITALEMFNSLSREEKERIIRLVASISTLL